jgi:Spy/CpxP family protein refolding chaperone
MVMTMTTFSLRTLVLMLVGAALVACAKRAPLPGDSVSEEGGVTLSPPRMSTSPSPSPALEEPREVLGPIESRLYPPELVMDHQGELGITSEQKAAISTETERGQVAMLRLQWELQAEKEKLVQLLDAERADEVKVQEAAARVMAHETKVKASHLAMLVRVKNILTPEQQARLRELRSGACSRAGAGSSGAHDGGMHVSPVGDH